MIRTLYKHLSYCWSVTVDKLQTFIFKALNAFSFLLIAFYLGYVVYYSTVCYNVPRVIVGCICLFFMIYLNKSL